MVEKKIVYQYHARKEKRKEKNAVEKTEAASQLFLGKRIQERRALGTLGKRERSDKSVHAAPDISVADLGTGNGRNLIYLAETFGMKGAGFDISREAIEQAKIAGKDLPLEFFVRSIAEPIPLPDDSQDIVLDMMTSHFLNSPERTRLLSEIARILKPGGFLFFKTFLLDEDIHAARLLREYPAPESGSYIHPEIGKAEHVFTEDEIITLLSPYFTIRKITKSHRHKIKGRAAKRRSISVYAEKEIR
ncbi:MAG: class I SAM-dependent methyltransferase [Candidatus Lloydbacteria bacterium]|nr:class I SAM-dependent methyltransferase [Candidatus Lloydbacteria bacterium]